MSPSHRRRLFIALGFSISILFIYLSFRKIEIAKVWQEIQKIDYPWMLLGVAVQFCGFFGMTLRSKLLLQPLHDFSLFDVYKSAFVSYTGNNIFPMRAGEVLRIDYLARKGAIAHSSTLAVIFVERLLDMGFLLVLFFVILPLFFTQNHIPTSSLYFPAAVVGVSLSSLLLMSRFPQPTLAFFRKFTGTLGQRVSSFLMEKLELFLGGLHALKSLWRVLLVLLGTMIFWVMNAGTLYCTLQAFHLGHLPWFTPILIQTFISFGAAIPSAPGFVGTYHYFFKSGLRVLGVTGALVDSMALVSHAFNIIPLTIFGLLLLMPDYLRSNVSLQSSQESLSAALQTDEPDQTEHSDHS